MKNPSNEEKIEAITIIFGNNLGLDFICKVASRVNLQPVKVRRLGVIDIPFESVLPVLEGVVAKKLTVISNENRLKLSRYHSFLKELLGLRNVVSKSTKRGTNEPAKFLIEIV